MEGDEYLCPWTVYRLDFSDSYNELLLKLPTLDVWKLQHLMWVLQNKEIIITCRVIYVNTNLFIFLFVLWCLNATFNNISVISWRSVLLVEVTEGPGDNHRPVTSHWQTLSHNAILLALIEIRTHNNNGDRHWLHR